MKKKMILLFTTILAAASLAGCSKPDNTAAESESPVAATASEFDTNQEIQVVSREDGSGTRGAFIELFGIEQKDEQGNKIDHTTEEANITNSTSVMMTTITGNQYAIGYISLGSLNDTVKALKIDGADASVESIANGSYKISRPFYIATKGTPTPNAQDFINYINSTPGKGIIEAAGYIGNKDTKDYTPSLKEGKVIVAGSSSVTPVMEKLKEGYIALNPNVTIEIQQSDSTTGMESTASGICDIGMASRELKDSEKEQGLSGQVIATDGIAVIVNNDNPINELTSEQVQNIFMGNTTEWSEITE